jgi:site-specific DNA recombinase
VTETQLRAALYARNSRGGRSVDDQLADGRDDCRRNNWTWGPDDEFVDVGRSASAYATRARERFEVMVERVQAHKYDILVAWESSRLQRDMEVYVFLRNLCRANRVLWSLNGRVYDMTDRQDRFVTGMDALRAEDEADIIRDRNLRTTRRSAARGWMHARTPMGYVREYDPLTGNLLRQAPDPATAEIVREMTRRVAAGESLASVAADLTARGVPTRQGAQQWIPSSVRVVVSNLANIGRRSHLGVDAVEAVWPAIVDEADFRRAQAVLSDPARKSTNERAVRHLLTGIARCGVEGCGRKLHLGTVGKRVLYRCFPSAHAAISKQMLEDYIEEVVPAYLERVDIAAVLARRGADGRLSEMLAQAAEAEAELNTARSRVGLPGGLSVASLAALEQNLLPLIDNARKQASVLLMPASVMRMAGPEARQNWGDATIHEKRVVLKHVVDIRLHPAGRGVRTIRPGRVVLTWPLTDAPDAS